MSQLATPQIERDEAAAAEQHTLLEQLTQDALHAYQDYQRAKKHFDETAARLAPYKNQLSGAIA